jgi:hypothetical protein
MRPEARDTNKGLRRAASWVILDGGKHIATGCLARETAKAESCLAACIAQKYRPSRQRQDIDEITIADVISIYVDDRKLQEIEGAIKLFARLERLNEFWTRRSSQRSTAKPAANTRGDVIATWLMQAGVDKWEAADFLGMTVEMLDRVYGRHHPQHLKKAARSIGYRHENETLAVSSTQRRPAQTDLPQPIEITGGPAWTRTRNQTVMSGRL